MNYKIALYLLVFLIIGSLSLLAFLVKVSKKESDRSKDKIKNKGHRNFFNSSYQFFYKNPLSRSYLLKVRKRIELLDLSDNWTINIKTMKYGYLLVGLSFLLFIIVLLISKSFYYIIIGSLLIYIMHNQFLILLIDKLEDRLLIQFEKFIGDIRHHYHEHGMVDEAIYDSLEECEYEMSRHGDMMYEVLTSEDIDESLLRYYDLVPNKYFKTFLALCYTLQKFGDKIVDGSSMFLSNLNYLKQEVNLEILRRRKLNYLFKSLGIISIMPIFFLPAIESWGKGNMPELKIYYEGGYGFLVQIILFFIGFLSFSLINKLQTNQNQNISKTKIEERLLKNNIIFTFIQRITYKNYSKTRKLEEVLKITGSKISVEVFYIRRYIFAFLAFVFSIIVAFNIHNISKKNILNNLSNSFIENEKAYILNYRGKNPTYFEIEEDLKSRGSIDKREIPEATKGILLKISLYNKHYFKWWELIIGILIGVSFYFIPYLLLIFKKTVVYLNMEDEVVQFHTIILMLMYLERISVEDLLEWMSMFAVIFKDSIDKCLNNFENGDIEALDQLIRDEPFLPFKRIVENLISASDKIPIISAFDELKTERAYYQEKRKQDNEIIISKKGNWGRIIAFIPMTLTMILYLITPFIHLSISQFIQYSEQIKNYL